MQRCLYFSLPIALLTLASAVSPGQAQENPSTPPIQVGTAPSLSSISPFDLVVLARRGQVNGVPGYAAFDNAYRIGTLTAETLVQSAANVGLVREGMVRDQSYLNAVNLQLVILRSPEF